MAWVQAFPTNATLISQSVQQIQDNWLFLQTNINTDHYFNTGAPTEGGHRQVQMQNLGADPALTLDAIFYPKAVNTRSQPFWRNAQAVWRMPFGNYGTVAYGAAGAPRTLNVFAFTVIGLYQVICNVSGADQEAFSCLCAVDAGNVHTFGFQQRGGVFTAVGNVGTTLTVTTTKNIAFTLRYVFWGMQI